MLSSLKIPAAHDFNAALSHLDLREDHPPLISSPPKANTGLLVAKQREFGMGSRLQDSMEFYKRQGVQVGNSPPPSPSALSPLEISRREEALRSPCCAGEESAMRKGFFSEDDEEEEEDGIIFEGDDGQVNGLQWTDEDDEDDYDDEGDSEEGSEAESNEDEEDDESLVFEDDDDGIRFGSDMEETEKEVPFWFGNEDRCQIKSIIGSYCTFLKVDEDRKRCIREPEPFVGRVKRVIVHKDEEAFTTLDKVEIFRRSLIVPPGGTMPLIKCSYLLTNWSPEDGVPTQFSELKQKETFEWKARAVSGAAASFLLCLPDFNSVFKDYDYAVSQEVQDVTHSPRSTVNEENHYGKYIPQDLLRLEKEKNALFMELNSRPADQQDDILLA